MIKVRLLVCGSRDGFDHYRFREEMRREWERQYHAQADFTERFSMLVIHGAARGVDTQAETWAAANGHAVLGFPADWERHDQAAGPIRNQQMIDEGKPTHGLVFPGGAGTLDMVKRLFAAGIPFRYVGRLR